jgi:putative tricarboxylic transport membrane protein
LGAYATRGLINVWRERHFGDTDMSRMNVVTRRRRRPHATIVGGAFWVLSFEQCCAQWQPTQPIEFVVPAGPGGGADQMARAIQAIVTKYSLTSQPMTVVNKAANAGVEGFLDIKASKGNPHKLVITLSNLFTTPLSTGIAFSWHDITPVAMMALDEFVLWVNADTPYKTAQDYIAAVKAAPAATPMKMGGTGSKQEDQIVTVAIEKAAGVKFAYLPFGGGGDVARQLVEKNVDSTVNNPIEAAAQWKAGKLRPLCVFDGLPLSVTDKIVGGLAWSDIPTCKAQGLDIEYLMLRGVFMPLGVSSEQVSYFVDLLKKVRDRPEWTALMNDGAFNQTFMTGSDYAKWISGEERKHRQLMTDAGFLAAK